MARIHGRNARLYASPTSGAAASPVAFLSSLSIDFSADREEVTAFGDSTKVYVAGLPDASGDYSGFYDDASNQFYTAATDGLARNFYIYPTTADTGEYFFGTGFFDFSLSLGVDGAATIDGSWSAASSVVKVST